MVFFSLFVIAAVILGAGAMLAPAWPSQAPRIGLSSTLLLGIISGGAVWWAQLFGWDTLIVDYLLFAIVSGVILGGTLSRGGDNAGWPSRRDLVFFGLVALICMMPLLVLRLPLGEHAASDALITLAVRDSGSFDSLAPFYPEVKGFAPPALHALAAYLSQQLHQNIPTIHMALGSLIAFLCAWTVYDLGTEIRDKRLGYSMAISLLGSFGMLGLLWQSYYSQLMGVLFAFAFITYALRYYRQHKWIDMLAAGLMLGAVLYCSPILFAICLGGYYILIIFMALPFHQASKHIAQWTIYSRLGLWFGILLVCLFGTGIWIIKNWLYIDYAYFTDCLCLYSSLRDDKASWLFGAAAILITIFLAYRLYPFFERMASDFDAYIYKIIVLSFILLIAIGTYLKGVVPQTATENDIAAMEWIRENTDEDALVANYPIHDLEITETRNISATYWFVLYAYRKAVYGAFPSYKGTDYYLTLAYELYDFWLIPVAFTERLNQYRIDYILIPDGMAFPRDLDNLRLVFEQGGARVYEVIGEE